jgi:hypothetical protein
MNEHTNTSDSPRQAVSDGAATPDVTTLATIEEQADKNIRRVMYNGRMFFSIIDVIALLTGSPRPRKYWYALKTTMQQNEGWSELSPNMGQLKMPAADGKLRETDAADTEALLRIIQSVPSPKAEPVKQWLARVGAERLEAPPAQPAAAISASHEIADLRRRRPEEAAPAMAWADYYAAMSTLYRRQAAYEAQLLYVDAKLVEHDEQIGELHSRMESLEEGQRLLPELLERLGPQTLTSEHQATVQAMANRLHDLSGASHGAIYNELRQAFYVGKYSEIAEARWQDVAAWFQVRVAAAQQRK